MPNHVNIIYGIDIVYIFIFITDPFSFNLSFNL
jgi:hypothetical protein